MTDREAAKLRAELQALREEVARLRSELACRGSWPPPVISAVNAPAHPWQRPVISGAPVVYSAFEIASTAPSCTGIMPVWMPSP